MDQLWIHQFFVFAGLVLLVSAETSVEELKAIGDFANLREDVFGNGHASFFGCLVEHKILNMIRLIEAGNIPAQVQGNQTLEYLKSMTDDCKRGPCSLDDDMQKAERLSKRDTGAPNLRNYLKLCRVRIYRRCESDVYKRANAKLSSVDEETMKAVDTLAHQAHKEIRPCRFTYESEPNGISINHATILRALKKLDPVRSKVITKKWTNKKTKLTEFMDRIRLPCIKFLQHIDPIVTLSAPKYYSKAKGSWKVSNWHFYLNTCRKLVDDWYMIFKNAYHSYSFYLSGDRPVKTSCFLARSGDRGDGKVAAAEAPPKTS